MGLNKVVNNWKSMLTGTLAMLFVSVVYANSVPYPGKIPVDIISIESPNIVVVGFETWPGFYRRFRVTLPGIEVPVSSGSACETAMAVKSLQYTTKFVTDAKKLYIKDMSMQTSADQDGVSHIFSENKSLAESLMSEGLARPMNGRGEKWCQD
jgi:hypothetical protein